MYLKDLQSKENIYTSDESLKISEDEKTLFSNNLFDRWLN